jgi:acyl-CoA synthetase (AMP-forming)/AMP-acid ligase II
MNGQKLVLPGRNFEPDKLCELIKQENVTVAAAVPTVWFGITNYLATEGLELPSLRAAMVAGTKAPRALVEDLERRGISVGQVWGMTEAAGGMRTTPAPGVAELSPDQQFQHKMRQGRMGFGTELRIVDDEGIPLPHDGLAVGHLEPRGPCIAAAYYRQPSAPPGGWLSTGNVARIHKDGTIEIVDRSKDFIKSGGEWISSLTIEAATMEHPAILHAAVIAIEHPKWQERPLLVAVPKPGAAVTAEEVLDHLSPLIPKWWMPDRLVFVESLPMTASGKVRKTELRRSFAEEPDSFVVQSHPEREIRQTASRL